MNQWCKKGYEFPQIRRGSTGSAFTLIESVFPDHASPDTDAFLRPGGL